MKLWLMVGLVTTVAVGLGYVLAVTFICEERIARLEKALGALRTSGTKQQPSLGDLYWQIDRACVAEDWDLALDLVRRGTFDANDARILNICCTYGRMDLVDSLMKEGVVLNQTNEEGRGPFYSVMLRRSDEDSASLVKQLLLRGGDPNLGIDTAKWPLGYAAINGFDKTLSTLLAAGAMVGDERAPERATGLMLAAKYGHYKCVAKLLEHGANRNVVDEEGKSALDLAMRDPIQIFQGEKETIKINPADRRKVIELLQ